MTADRSHLGQRIKDDRVTISLAPPPRDPSRGVRDSVLVACPDARPPAYEAVAGLSRSGLLGEFVTAFYDRPDSPVSAVAHRLGPIGSKLSRRSRPDIPPDRVRSFPAFDACLAVENRSGPRLRDSLARWRTRRFDRLVRDELRRTRPRSALLFSDVGSEFAIPFCRSAGMASVLSVVHGDVHEELDVLARERVASPDFFPIYLGGGPVEAADLRWLHDRRLREQAEADAILVPSGHLADRLEARGIDRSRISVVPYAADLERFRPIEGKTHRDTCTFLFAGGITQRKGIKYLLEAWRKARRPGWRLALVGALPRDPSPLEPYREEVEFLGRVGHSEMPGVMAGADVFVFPSLFEGSAVVTYEALACGLPTVTTREAGSVVRDGQDGRIVPSADVESLATALEALGLDPDLRDAMSRSARQRAELHDWGRYQEAVSAVVAEVSPL